MNPYKLNDSFFKSSNTLLLPSSYIISENNAKILEELTPKINKFFSQQQLTNNLKVNGTIVCDNVIAKNLQTVDKKTGNITSNITVNSVENTMSVFQANSGNIDYLQTKNIVVSGNLTGNVIGDVNGNATSVTDGIYTTSSVTELNDIHSKGSGAIITTDERNKLDNCIGLEQIQTATYKNNDPEQGDIENITEFIENIRALT